MTPKTVGDAVLQRDGTSYGLMVGGAGGVVTPDELERIARTAREHGVPLIKLTRGQRIALLGIPGEKAVAVARALGVDEGRPGGPCMKYVAACPGTAVCRWGMQDALALARELEERFGTRTFPSKLKIGVSGCARNCSSSFFSDLGFIGTGRGWMVFFGGNGARRPRNADLVASNLTDDQALDLADRLVNYYASHGRSGERTARFVERLGLETIRSELLRFVPYIPLE